MIFDRAKRSGEICGSKFRFTDAIAQSLLAENKKRPRSLAAFLSTSSRQLLGSHFLGLAFLPHQLQLTLRFFVCGSHFLLHANRGFFQLR